MSVDCPLDDELEGFEGALRERFVRHRRREARLNVTPHIAQNISGRRSAIDARTTRHGGYVVSQQKRKRIEESFGWGKTIGGLARPMLRGVKKLGFKFILTMAGYNLIRLPKLIEAAA
jgi:Transposase DDE domain